MAGLARATSFRTKAIAAGAILAVAAGGVLWWAARRLPVEEARQFLEAPIEVGEEPPPPPAAPAPQSEVERRFAEAESEFDAGQYARAAEGFAFVVAEDPRGPHAGSAQWNLTRSRLRSGEGAGALGALDDLLRHYGAYLGEESPGLRAGLEHMEKGDLPAAQAAFERMIADQKGSEFVPLAHALIARIHWTHGEPMETVRSFARMFASVRDRVPAYSVLAKQLERYARGDRGVTDTFHQMAEEAPEGFRDIYKYLEARSLLEQDQFEKTRESLEELRRQHPGGDFTHIVDLEQAWNLLREQKPAEALAIFERLERESEPADKRAMGEFFDLRAELPLGIARCHLAMEHWPEAAAAFERAVAGGGRVYALENRLGLARAYEGMGELDRAAAVLRQIIEKNPDEPELWAIRQQLERVEGRIAKAEPAR